MSNSNHDFVYLTEITSGDPVTTSVLDTPPDNDASSFDFGSTPLDLGIGLHVIIGQAGTGKSLLVNQITRNLDSDSYGVISLMEPVEGAHTTINAAFTDQFNDETKRIFFIDSLRILAFMRGASLTGGVSVGLPLVLTELSVFALNNKLALVVVVNTISAQMTENLKPIIGGSVTSVIVPSVVLDNKLITITGTVNSRKFLREDISFEIKVPVDDVTHDTSESVWSTPNQVKTIDLYEDEEICKRTQAKAIYDIDTLSCVDEISKFDLTISKLT